MLPALDVKIPIHANSFCGSIYTFCICMEDSIMLFRKSLLNVFIVLAATQCAGSGTAQAGGPAAGGASEFTQILNNGELLNSVGVQTDMFNVQIEQYLMQEAQVALQERDFADSANWNLKKMFGDNWKSADRHLKARNASIKLKESSVNYSKLMNADYESMRKNEITPTAYYTKVADAAAQGDVEAQEQIDESLAANEDLKQKSMIAAAHAEDADNIDGEKGGFKHLAIAAGQATQVAISNGVALNHIVANQAKERSEREAFKNSEARAKTERENQNTLILEEYKKQMTVPNGKTQFAYDTCMRNHAVAVQEVNCASLKP